MKYCLHSQERAMNRCPHFDLMNPDVYADGIPFQWFTELRAESPISWQEDPRLGRGYWAITKREHLDFISKSTELFSSAAEASTYGLDEMRITSGTGGLSAARLHRARWMRMNRGFAPSSRKFSTG
jgi:hypothetical protein